MSHPASDDRLVSTARLNRSYRIVPGTLLAGCYPGAKNPKEAEPKLEGLLACGIRFVVNLMAKGTCPHDVYKYAIDPGKPHYAKKLP